MLEYDWRAMIPPPPQHVRAVAFDVARYPERVIASCVGVAAVLLTLGSWLRHGITEDE